MGCCFSKKDRRIPADAPPPPDSEANAPPVEETVKEVLSETPKLSSGPPPLGRVKRSAAALISDERSDDASEICSLSESVSTAATTATEKAEELERFREWRAERSASPAKAQRKRSLSGEFPGGMRRERGGGGGGRYSPSPSRRAEKSLSGREVVQAARSRGGGAVVAANGVRRDPGERSGRRSASPANGRAAADAKGLGRSSSSRRGMASPRRAPLPEPEEDGGWGVEKAAFPAAANELLENPLVSLECFIFL